MKQIIIACMLLLAACSKKDAANVSKAIDDSHTVPSSTVVVCGDKILMGAGMAFLMVGAQAYYLNDGVYGDQSCYYKIQNGKVVK